MDKTKNISLGGFSFLIEENAYTALSQYLTEVRQHLQHNSDRDEIIFDVEQRMAELLKDRTANREVIMHQDVLYLIEVPGNPEQYVEDEEADKATNAAPEASAQAFSANKPLYRDIDDCKIGGVLSGMAHYFNISPTMLRIAFAVCLILSFVVSYRWIFLFNGVSWAIIILYILLWMIVPAAVTTAQKLELLLPSIRLPATRVAAPPLPNGTRVIATKYYGGLSADLPNTPQSAALGCALSTYCLSSFAFLSM